MSQPPHDTSAAPAEDFTLTGDADTPALALRPLLPDAPLPTAVQAELILPEGNPEQPEETPQIEFAGMAAPRFRIHLTQGQELHFQHARTLLESLEAQQVDIHYQCREGYCGSCRVQLLEGAVHYLQEPMAWLDDDEILPCCCIPRTDLKIKL